MNWIILFAASLCEVGFTLCLGKTKGLSGLVYWEWMGGSIELYLASFLLLSKATQTIPMGTAYPIWTGIGAAGAVLVGIFLFKEPVTFWRLFFLTTLISSVVGLKLLSAE